MGSPKAVNAQDDIFRVPVILIPQTREQRSEESAPGCGLRERRSGLESLVAQTLGSGFLSRQAITSRTRKRLRSAPESVLGRRGESPLQA